MKTRNKIAFVADPNVKYFLLIFQTNQRQKRFNCLKLTIGKLSMLPIICRFFRKAMVRICLNEQTNSTIRHSDDT